MSDTGQKILPNPGRVRVTTYKGVRKADTQKLVVQPNMEPDDEFNDLYYSTKNQGALLLAPPFNPATLQSLVTKNNILAQCIEAMEVNIDGTGYEIEATDPKASESDDAANKKKLTAFFKEPFPLWGFTEMRRKLRYDMESTGNGYLEVLRNAGRQIIFLRWADSKLMRLVRLDDPVEVEVELDRDGEKVKAKILTRERRYCQLLGTEQIFFKEFGSKRKLHRKTGKWESEGNPVPDDQQATEMLHFTVHKDARTPYGLPRWINQLPSVLGSRKAEEFNLDFFDSGAIPPAAIFLQGGQVTEQVGDQLRAYFGPKNKEPNRVAVVEVQSTSGTIDSAGHVQVKVERFGDNQKDAMFTNYDDKCEAHVRTAFRLPPLFVGKAQDYNFACYSDDTETLTDQGWIRWDEFREGMRIATVNPQTLALEYHRPFGNRAMVYDVEGVEMYSIRKGSVDLMVTPKHRMMFSTYEGRRRVEPIEDMMGLKTVRFSSHVSGRVGGKRLESFVIPKVMTGTYSEASLGGQVIEGDLFLEFLGYWISEGTASDAYSQRGIVTVGQKKPMHLEKIQKCFDRLGESLTTYRTEQSNGMVYLSVKNFGLKEWLVQKCGSSASTKRLPNDFRELPQDQLQILFDALMLGDGTYDSRENRKSGAYSTTSKSLADDFQELATMLGYRTILRKERSGTLGIRPVYRVLLTRDAPDSKIETEKDVVRVPYTGKVYCFSVPNGVFITRRNGRVALQGNTAQVGYMVTEAQVFGPERTEFDEIVNRTIVKELGIEDYKFVSKPLTIQNIDAQLKALELAKDKSDGENFVEEVNSLTGLNLEYSKEVEQQALSAGKLGPDGKPIVDPIAVEQEKGKIQEKLKDKEHSHAKEMFQSTAEHQMTMAERQQAQAEEDKKKKLRAVKAESAEDIVTLVTVWSQAMGLERSAIPLSEEEKALVIGTVRKLDESKRAIFDNVLAVKSFANVSNDPTGLAEIASCCADHME